MPGSSYNAKSTVPCCQQKRRVSKTRHFQKDKYHPNCIPQNDNGSENIKKVNNKNIKQKQCGAVGSQKREVVKLISHDMIREIIIPKQDNLKAVVFDSSRFGYLKDKSKHLTEKDKQEMVNKAKEKKAKEAAESAMRKKDLQSCDIYREHGTHLQELEEEAERRANHLLARAFELRQEQEDEIKKCNALILGTKCHAIRDAQMAEKALIQKELEEEERRLEMMMEEERLKAVREQEKLKEREAMKKKAFTEAILEQIKENEIQREMIAESIEEESRLANEAAMQAQLDELKAYKERQAEQAKLRQEMHMINQQLQKIAATEREENRLADLKVQEFMRRKAEQEKAREEEANQLRLAKEKELARLRAMQERAADVQAQKDEINAQRIQDEVEREWRRKEREAALRRAQENEELKKARSKQVEDRRRCQAIEIQREKEESEKIAKVNLAALQREQEEHMRRLCATDEHRMALLKQINEKERERIKNRQQQFQEGVAIKMEEKKRNETLKDTMMKKMAQIRGHRVPEKYVREVERQLKLNE